MAISKRKKGRVKLLASSCWSARVEKLSKDMMQLQTELILSPSPRLQSNEGRTERREVARQQRTAKPRRVQYIKP